MENWRRRFLQVKRLSKRDGRCPSVFAKQTLVLSFRGGETPPTTYPFSLQLAHSVAFSIYSPEGNGVWMLLKCL